MKKAGIAAAVLAVVSAAAVAVGLGAGRSYEKVEVDVTENAVQAVGASVITQGTAAGEDDGKAAVTLEGPSGQTGTAAYEAEESGSGPAGTAGTAAVTEASAAASSAAETSAAAQETAAAVSFEERSETVYATTDQLNIRRLPSADGEVAGKVNTGTELKRTGYSEEWSRVEYEGEVCYAASRYLDMQKPAEPETGAETAAETAAAASAGAVSLNPDWKYAGYSKISSGHAVLYRSEAANRKGKVVCVNAGHGTSGGESVKTQCHPDGTPKVTGGTTGAGATSAVAVSGGMTFADGTPERKVTLSLALALKEKLLARGYDVLMIRESDDVQLDNIARTVIANNAADCHIALHWDSTTSDKGAFYMSVPDIASYRSMEPVASHWQEHHALGESLISGLKGAGVKIFSGGSMAMDLTQTSYSTVPSVDIELGDKVSDHSASAIDTLAGGLADGVDAFFGN